MSHPLLCFHDIYFSYKRCLSGHHAECANGEECFASTSCKGLKNQPGEKPKEVKPTLPPSPTVSPMPTPIPIITEEPTMSPLEADNYKNFFFCGTSWMDATQRCHKRCISSLHSDCPDGEECFAQADCKNGVKVQITPKPTVAPTRMPFAGTRSPTSSPVPTNMPTGKSAFVLFYPYCVSMVIWLLHLSLHYIYLLALATHMH